MARSSSSPGNSGLGRSLRPALLFGGFFLFAALVILIFGHGIYREQETRLLKDIHDNLAAVAALKAGQIEQWRFERRGDAGIIMDRAGLAEAAGGYFRRANPDDEKRLLQVFRSLIKWYGYRNVSLCDRSGGIRLSVLPTEDTLSSTTRSALEEAFRLRSPSLSDLYSSSAPVDTPPGAATATARMDVVAPLYGSGPEEPFGAIILALPAEKFLIPFIESWPVPSKTAETLLVRRSGEEVVFLNELRHRKQTAFQLRFSLDQNEIPAVMAANGNEGVVEGIDYRGVPVLAALKGVAGTSWKIVAKLDREEALAEWKNLARLITLLVLFLLAILLLASLAAWERASRGHFQRLAATRNELRRVNTELERRVADRTAELEKSGALLEEAQRLARLGSWELDLATNELRWSREVFRIFEIDPNRFGASYEAFLALIHPDDRGMVNEFYRQSLADRKPYEVTHRLLMLDGRTKYVHERGRTDYDGEGKALRSIGTVQDITETHIASETMRRSERIMSLGRLSAGIAHEISQPLSGITMGIENLQVRRNEGRLTEEYLVEKCRTLLGYADRIRSIIEHVRLFAREPSTNRPELFDVNRAADGALVLVEALFRRNRVELEARKEENIPHVMGNPYRCEQVILNLLSNACFAAAARKRSETDPPPRVTLSTEAGDGEVILRVEDNGVGIPPTALVRIFEPFFTTKGPDEGTGLGLSICHEIIAEMGGAIRVESAVNENTQVTVTIPTRPRMNGGGE